MFDSSSGFLPPGLVTVTVTSEGGTLGTHYRLQASGSPSLISLSPMHSSPLQ